MIAPLVFLLAIGTVIAFALSFPKGDLVISVRPSRITIRGRLPQGKEGQFRSFFEQFAERRFTVVYNYPRGAARPPVRFRGRLTDGEKQQIRNFLLSEL